MNCSETLETKRHLRPETDSPETHDTGTLETKKHLRPETDNPKTDDPGRRMKDDPWVFVFLLNISQHCSFGIAEKHMCMWKKIVVLPKHRF